MLLAASRPELVGAIVLNGAPMSYWSGNDGENPMRYAGGLMGGAWSSLLASDLGAGKFDGAHLVQHFENLNPANKLWGKYYHLWDNIDTETEGLIQTALGELLKNRTSLVIAHRLSTIRRAHRILVLDQGQIKESGTHEQLLGQKGFYYNLYKLQYEKAAGK